MKFRSLSVPVKYNVLFSLIRSKNSALLYDNDFYQELAFTYSFLFSFFFFSIDRLAVLGKENDPVF